MLGKFKTQELIFITLISAMIFVFDLILVSLGPQGSPQQIITLPLSIIITAILVTILIKTLPKFGALTLFALVYAILEFPTPLGVAPGFWPKIVINVFSALLGDLFIYAFRYKNWSIFVGALIFGILNQLMFILAMMLFGIPLSSHLSVFLIPIILASVVMLGFGFWIGLKIWERIKDRRIIRLIKV